MCRALCCATWLSRFNSVSTAAARFQNLAQNSLKLTGQCGKLKCCTNYEVDVYMEAKKAFPSSRIPLETESGTYYFNKCDLLAGEITYSLAPKSLEEPETISVERAKEIIEMNQRGEIPETLSDLQEAPKKPKDILFDNAINRFDQPKKRKRRKTNRKRERSKMLLERRMATLRTTVARCLPRQPRRVKRKPTRVRRTPHSPIASRDASLRQVVVVAVHA